MTTDKVTASQAATLEGENAILRRALREVQGRPCPRWNDERQWSAYKRELQRMVVESERLMKEKR